MTSLVWRTECTVAVSSRVPDCELRSVDDEHALSRAATIVNKSGVLRLRDRGRRIEWSGVVHLERFHEPLTPAGALRDAAGAAVNSLQLAVQSLWRVQDPDLESLRLKAEHSAPIERGEYDSWTRECVWPEAKEPAPNSAPTEDPL